MNDTSLRAAIPPFFFHYIIVFWVAVVIVCLCVLKFKYFYWYEQPLTFRWSIRRFFRVRGSDVGSADRHATSIMNPLSLGTRCYTAVVYPFLHYVNHDTVRVFRAAHDEDIPFERISRLLMPTSSKDEGITHKNAGLIAAGGTSDTLRLLLSQETFGLSAFIGVFMNKDTVNHDDENNNNYDIRGVSVLTPRIMISFGSSLSASAYRSVSIYMSEYLAWNQYTMTERESLELLETTEYIQKCREIAGEQNLYRYSEIPWFVIPFSTVYSYVFSTAAVAAVAAATEATTRILFRPGLRVVRVSSANFALFYAFVNDRTRDFRICILNELTQLQSLVEHGLYQIYMLLLNQTRVIALYVFTQSSSLLADAAATADAAMSMVTAKPRKNTKGNRIADLHDYISSSSTALVKYLPPVIPPKYDAFGKRIAKTTTTTTTTTPTTTSKIQNPRDFTTMRLISSIQDKTGCERADFLRGFQYCVGKLNSTSTVTIDTIAHNHRIIDALLITTSSSSSSSSPSLLSKEKWYYILYNAIIHEETLCKDIFMV